MHPRLAVLFVFMVLPAFCGDWNPRRAAEYMDSRQKQWFAWPRALKYGVPCVSCHTGVPYLLARPALRRALGESRPTPYEAGLLDTLRSRLGKRTPSDLYPDVAAPHASEEASVEAIFSALFLTGDANFAVAFDRMWSLQLREGNAKGGWAWNLFDLDPWEMPHSAYYGAALAALAAGRAPAEYRDRPAVRERITALIAYLRRELPAQPLHNQLVALWAATRLPGLLPGSMRQSILDAAWRSQQPDGGWPIASLGPWKQHPQAPRSTGSSSYATALTAFVLQKAAPDDPRLRRALDWLRSRQDAESGSWPDSSMNKHREDGSIPQFFMRDAATAYAALALLESSGGFYSSVVSRAGSLAAAGAGSASGSGASARRNASRSSREPSK